MVPEISSVTDRTFPLPPPLQSRKPKFRKNFKKKKRKQHREISSLYTSVPKIMIMCYIIAAFHFGQFFFPFAPLTAQKMIISKKCKQHLIISSFYTIVSKFMITGYTVPDIWHMTDVIVVFHFWQFFALLPP